MFAEDEKSYVWSRVEHRRRKKNSPASKEQRKLTQGSKIWTNISAQQQQRVQSLTNNLQAVRPKREDVHAGK